MSRLILLACLALVAVSGCFGDAEPTCNADSDSVVVAGCAPAWHGTVTVVTEADGGSSCLPGPCEAGWSDCDGNPENGCEADLTLPDHCGACGNVCPVGMRCEGTLNPTCI